MKSVIMPQHFYTEPNVTGSTTLTGSTVRLFNTDIEPYEQNLTKAQYYMNLYLNQTGSDPEYGPEGDADQSGTVDFDDWILWRMNIGTAAADVPINIYPEWPFIIDPDYDNFQGVKAADQLIWSAHYGTEY
jgi:hypothetical protein